MQSELKMCQICSNIPPTPFFLVDLIAQPFCYIVKVFLETWDWESMQTSTTRFYAATLCIYVNTRAIMR